MKKSRFDLRTVYEVVEDFILSNTDPGDAVTVRVQERAGKKPRFWLDLETDKKGRISEEVTDWLPEVPNFPVEHLGMGEGATAPFRNWDQYFHEGPTAMFIWIGRMGEEQSLRCSFKKMPPEEIMESPSQVEVDPEISKKVKSK